MSSTSPTVPSLRTAKLAKFFNSVLHGSRPLKTAKHGELFIEALCDQPDPPTCIEKVISSSAGLSAVQSSLRFDCSISFHNGPATALIRYIQDPGLKTILGGDYVRKVTQSMVEPPIFWNGFLLSFRNASLDVDAQQCFGWLLHELLCERPENSGSYLAIAQDPLIQALLLDSPAFEVRTMGQKIRHFTSSLDAPDVEPDEYGPGGRHDNDFADFREVAIHPTADEIRSAEPPFLRLAEILEDPAYKDKRLAVHLDNQFRLLREDLLTEMRDELQIISGDKKGRRRGITVEGLRLLDVDCGEPKKRLPWGLQLQLMSDLPQLAKLKVKERKDILLANPNQARKDYFMANPNLFKHQSLGCLIVDEEISAFPTIHRDVDQLARKPPIITLQFRGKASTSKSLLKLKTAKNVKLVQIDTAVFAYEPVLRGLQEIRDLSLADELLLWSPDSVLVQPPDVPIALVNSLENDPSQDIQGVLQTPKSIRLDEAQMSSLLTGLKQRVSLIQGPPGTGKSFIGALIAKSIFRLTRKTILVVCYTNHALDQFLEELLDIGIPADRMLRLGGKSTSRTKCMSLYDQPTTFRQTKDSWKVIDDLKQKTEAHTIRLHRAFDGYKSTSIRSADLLGYLEFLDDGADFYDAFTVPEAEDGLVTIGPGGKAVSDSYLFDRWSSGQDAGLFYDKVPENAHHIWQMEVPARQASLSSWKLEILKEQVSQLYAISEQYNEAQGQLGRMFRKNDAQVIASRRIIACTTTAAAKYAQELEAASRDVVLVEEAGEILESHIITSFGPQTQQLVLIGDHKQLRPKVKNHDLSVEKGDGYDLNRSLFERLILKGFPHETLTKQHRMRPTISALVRSLTYPDLTDAPRTLSRPDLRGFQDNLMFISHSNPEDDAKDTASWRDMSSISSKQNRFEVDMVLKCVRYLAQQGYGTDNLVILTPYLGQLSLLKQVLSTENDPVLNDLDTSELIHAGLMLPASVNANQRKIRLATIDNYQGEESDIVVASLTRSNPRHDIGFMSEAERLNVLLSRARNALILIGNPETFLNARKGKVIWTKLWGLLKDGGHVYDGFPVRCERHPQNASLLRQPKDFDVECPDGGCKEPCGTMLNCGIHLCPQRCHQSSDHSKMQCKYMLHDKCPKGHERSWKCHDPPRECTKCEADKRRKQKELQRALKEQEKRARDEQEHSEHMAKLDALLAEERQRLREAQLSKERALAVQQKQRDLADAQAMTVVPFDPLPDPQSTFSADSARAQPTLWENYSKGPALSANLNPQAPPNLSKGSGNQPSVSTNQPAPDWTKRHKSPAKEDWEHQKRMDNSRNRDIDSVMDLIGLEEVKLQILKIKAKIEVSIRQNADTSRDRLNVSFLGNPGTGKTTIARFYARILATLGALPGSAFVETTGARLANEGIGGAKKRLEEILGAGGGVLFLDEAYQLTEDHNESTGRPVLDFLLAEMENNVGKIVFIFAGYNKNMEKFFEHNPGLISRVPYTFKFADYENGELLWILQQFIEKRYKGRMSVEGGKGGLYMRIIVQRLGRRRECPGFGNARAIETTYIKVADRQAARLARERREGRGPDDFYLCKEDLIGPDPSKAIVKCAAWDKLHKMIGLGTVKEALKIMVDRIGTNYQRELMENEPVEVSLNRVFLGSPGTGKTSVAKLYGQILADLGILSNGEVVMKNPADFMGKFIGHSEANAKAILASAMGKVLIIDEAYMLYTGTAGGGSTTDSFKTAIVDTIVAEVQSVPGEDRCVLLLGYEDKMVEMFQNVNPGLSRRFAIENAFRFEDFTDHELLEILNLKLKSQDLQATDEAKAVAIGVLSRGRNRPNFGNAGEVENQLGLAKNRHQRRESTKKASERSSDIIFEPEDFDPEYNRGANASANIDKLFEDVVGCEDVIAKLRGYQQIAQGMKVQGLDPRGQIPTNFLFKGPPGTGKTTTARKIGQVYYNLGYLSSIEVIECSASDLIGQYIGHTGPKTCAQLDKALGKVLFIDEAYRLAESSFATEAINELVDQLTKPKYMDKLIVVLAGYAQEINKLISTNPGLSSRFPEEILFKNMSPMQCLEILQRTIQKHNIQTSALTDPDSQIHVKMVGLIEEFSALPSWGNARDIKTLAKTLVGFFFRKKATAPDVQCISEDDIIRLTEDMLQERKDRCANLPSTLPIRSVPKAAEQSHAPPPPPPPVVESSSAQPDATPSAPSEGPKPAEPQEPDADSEASAPEPQEPAEQRDAGVSDQTWAQLQSDMAAAKAEPNVSDEAFWAMDDDVSTAWEDAHQAELALKRLDEAKAKDEADTRRLKREREKARAEREKARRERDKAEAELERMRIRRIEEETERAVQERLRNMGVCVQGFQWIKQASGYRCAGGSHYIGNDRLGV